MEVVAGIVILFLLLLVGGVCAAANQKTTLALSPDITEPGGSVTVTATHVPANQVGQIVLHSQPFAFPFQAGGSGDVSEVITVPLDAGLGDHTVDLWWGGSSHVQKILHVVAPGTLPSPTPSTNPSPTASGNPTANPTPRRSPSPGASPKPGTSPTAAPSTRTSPKPSPKPSPRPTPSPTPTSNPCPTPTSGASLSGPSSVNSGAFFTVTGANFTPGKIVTINYYDPAGANTPTATKTLTVSCNGSFSWTFKAATLLLGLSARNDKVTAIDGAGRNSSYGFKLNPVL